jgi:hypothetical protein
MSQQWIGQYMLAQPRLFVVLRCLWFRPRLRKGPFTTDAHAPMEPLTCVVRLTGEVCEIWAGDQF